ncbi:ABC transporter ATP-binding protein [Dokdonia pacifica]|uniref:ABC-type bacteriocin/lantibiotic exporter, contains an N-terminal double-glycine peptidase domain n=1 Tax=Dokdonia pacifica TaxID=1627892 RepID=A0A238ZEX8_9FLAO|nr:ATP-binding cassette domain-containing protein [Dokdonia pacifica]GGG05864.1 ABC transporter ATP-binding protein [Dokdonia pacifica]SNR81521.1 ABC-type bacteriocin/lantibiotic exporter, contains an N-terminal double-glycine peptidase domain [Dokdonia pacifica]
MAKTVLTATQRLTGLLQLDRKDIKQIIFYAIFAGIVSLSLPLGIQAIINLLQGAQMSTSWVILVVLVTIGTIFVGALQLMQMRILENVQQKLFTRSSFEFAYRFPKIKMSELSNYYPPELANRFFDTLTIQKSLPKILIDFPAAILQITFGLLLLSFYHPFFIIYGVLLIFLVYLVFKFTVQKGLDTSLDESQQKYKVAHWIQEIARTITSFKLSGQTSLALEKNDKLVLEYLRARESHFKILVLQFMQMVGFKVLVTAGLLIIGGILVLNQQMNIGQFVAAEIIILLVISSVEKLITGLESVYDVLTSLEKIGQVVDKELEAQDGDKPLDNNTPLTVELKDIRYNGIIKDISLTLEPGQNYIVQGPQGSGKTTLLRLIAGIYEPSAGDIFINDRSLKSIHLNHYRSYIGQSLNEESPFEGTLKENITFGDNSITEKQIDWAIEKTGLSSFIKTQEKGLQTIIYPEGRQIPYTIAKKIVLARSIIRKPKLLILKDPLDHFSESEADKLIEFLAGKEHPWTLLVVSQNPKWKQFCHNHIIVEKGAIIKK